MSELKAYIAPTADGTGLADYYLKSEADKVIEEKDKELRRQKYKRCLAMAKWCYDRWIRAYHSNKLAETRFYVRWQKRWLELAEKFKPNNQTAQ